MLKQALNKVSDGKNLSFEEAGNIIDYISEGKALPTEIAAFLTALKMKGETPEEITGFVIKIREKALKIDIRGNNPIVDACGTGGDKSNTFNISTTSSILASSSGLKIAKHCNIGFTSQCGSSNVIEALGLNLAQTPQDVTQSLKVNNIAFIHAPYFQKALSHVNPIRREIGIRTIFNYLGPLSNPVNLTGQILGISNLSLAPKILETLKNIGIKKAMVVAGVNPILDEISICGKTQIYKLENNNMEFEELYPEDFGFNRANINELSGSTPEYNAQLIEAVLSGRFDDAKLDAILLNTAAILWAGEKVYSIEDGIKTALSLIETGKGIQQLKILKK